MQVERRGFDPEYFGPARLERERHGLFAGRTDGGRNSREHCLRGAVNMTCRYQQGSRMPPKHGCERVRVS